MRPLVVCETQTKRRSQDMQTCPLTERPAWSRYFKTNIDWPHLFFTHPHSARPRPLVNGCAWPGYGHVCVGWEGYVHTI
jgi:hypothetical protein